MYAILQCCTWFYRCRGGICVKQWNLFSCQLFLSTLYVLAEWVCSRSPLLMLSSCGTEEVCLLCFGSHPLEQQPHRDKNFTFCPKVPEKSQNLALLPDLDLIYQCIIVFLRPLFSLICIVYKIILVWALGWVDVLSVLIDFLVVYSEWQLEVFGAGWLINSNKE